MLFKAGKFWCASTKYEKESNSGHRQIQLLQKLYNNVLCSSISEQTGIYLYEGKCINWSSCYLQAANYLEFDHSFTVDEKSTANAIWLSCNLNTAACKLKLGEYLEASRLCMKVLASRSPLSVRSLISAQDSSYCSDVLIQTLDRNNGLICCEECWSLIRFLVWHWSCIFLLLWLVPGARSRSMQC